MSQCDDQRSVNQGAGVAYIKRTSPAHPSRSCPRRGGGRAPLGTWHSARERSCVRNRFNARRPGQATSTRPVVSFERTPPPKSTKTQRRPPPPQTLTQAWRCPLRVWLLVDLRSRERYAATLFDLLWPCALHSGGTGYLSVRAPRRAFGRRSVALFVRCTIRTLRHDMAHPATPLRTACPSWSSSGLRAPVRRREASTGSGVGSAPRHTRDGTGVADESVYRAPGIIVARPRLAAAAFAAQAAWLDLAVPVPIRTG